MGVSMSTLRKLAVLSLAAAAMATPDNNRKLISRQMVVPYIPYHGDGSTAAGWPDQSQWISSFDTMWDLNYNDILTGNPGHESELSNLKAAIGAAEATTGVDARFILAMIMQESSGRIRVETTSFGASGANPGLMQAHGGPSCSGQAECGYDQILSMIMQGVQNGGDGMNIENLMDHCGKPAPQSYYWAARLYNSGINSMPPENNNDLTGCHLGATPSYASDVANRLMGLTDADGAHGSAQFAPRC